MNDIAIRVENLSKQYQIGRHSDDNLRSGYKSLREVLTNTVAAPIRRVSALLRGDAYAAAEMTETIWALKDVSFEVKQGEVVGIIGHNGAGKSTLLKILSRITEPSTGSAEIHGRVGSLLEVGTGFHPELTGRENVYLNGAILGMRRTEIVRQFDEIVAFAEVEKFIDTPVKHYSSGMYLRLAFAVAAHLEPEILLVDEVLSVGDVAFQKKCLGKMEEVGHNGRTVLFVSHNTGAIKTLCPSAILFDAGRIVQIGRTVDVMPSYLQRYISLESEFFVQNDEHHDGQNFRIIRVAISDENGTPCTQIPFTHPFQVIVEVHLKRNVSGIHIGVGVATSDGIRLTTTHHSDTIDRTEFSSGKTTFRCRFAPNLLAPGMYYLHVGAHSEDSLFSDYVPEALAFEILSFSFTSENDFNSQNYGIFRHPAQWSIES